MEKLLAKESPLVTTVKVIGALEAKPISTYTEKKRIFVTQVFCQ